MGKISVIISDDVERQLREKAVKKFSWKKGTLSLAVEEAIKLWLKEQKS